jgi:hypothetical protein
VGNITDASGSVIPGAKITVTNEDEVDLVVETGSGTLIGIELKAGATVNAGDFKGQGSWRGLAAPISNWASSIAHLFPAARMLAGISLPRAFIALPCPARGKLQ